MPKKSAAHKAKPKSHRAPKSKSPSSSPKTVPARSVDSSDHDSRIREELVRLLHGGSAHAEASVALKDVAVAHRGKAPSNSPHTLWQLLFHLRVAQRDILDFCRKSDYVAPKFPDDYWPESLQPASPAEWDQSVSEFLSDLKTFADMIENPSNDLHRRIPWGDGQTLLREALVLADHNSYHLGQFVLIRKELQDWKD